MFDEIKDSQKRKQQTAIISVAGNVVITAVKFTAFSFTGSLVVLADAWHSLTDIITSFMVLFALKKDSKAVNEVPDPDKGFLLSLMNASYEIKSSILIGSFIFMVGISLLMRAFFEELEIVKYPLVSGFCFLFFALLSFIIYRFETSSGRKFKSPGLISDGMHSRSDALTSLFAGISLILYYLGMDTERFSASVISLIIISFGIEVVINSLRAVKNPEDIFDLKINQILFIVFTKEFWEKIDRKFSLNLTSFYMLNQRWIKWAFIILLGLGYLSTALFMVAPSSSALVERFGRPLDKVYEPGLHFKLPFPFDTVRSLDTKSVQKIDIGNVLKAGSFALLWTQDHGSDQPFISGDNNLFYPYITIYYNIADIKTFLYSSEKAREIFTDISESVINEVFSKYSFFDIATYQRAEIPKSITFDIQKYADELNLGIRIVSLTVNDVHPPIPIATYFEDVIAAFQDKEMMINRSIAFKNQQIPEARSEAIREIEQARAYSADRVNTAEGLSESFIKRLEGYSKYPDILKNFYIIDILSKIYRGKDLFIVDEDLPMPDLWISSLPGILSADGANTEPQSPAAGQMTPEEKRFLDQ